MAKKKEKQKRNIKGMIEELRKRLEELEEGKIVREERVIEKEEKIPEKGSIVSSVLGGIIPGLGKFVETLQKASPEFRERIEETDKQIRSNLAKGAPARTHIHYGYCMRSLARPIEEAGKGKEFVIREARKKEEPNVMLIWEKTPLVEKEDLKIYPIGRKLIIKIKGKLYKEIALPFYAKKIEAKYEKGKKEGLLCVKVEKR